MTSCFLDWAAAEMISGRQVNSHGIDVASVRRHIAKTTGQKTLTAIEPVPCLMHIWDWYQMIHRHYGVDFYGSPLSAQTWQEETYILTGIQPTAHEVQLLGQIHRFGIELKRTATAETVSG